MLWDYLKEKMLLYPQKHISECNAKLTFEETVVFAQEFAKQLTASCYAILCQSELATALAILSCFAANVTAVPMSYKYGETHCKRILQKIHPPFIITDIGGELHVVDVDTGEFVPRQDPPSLIMCTSGTTGMPKGVMLSEENILTNILDIDKYFQLNSQDQILIARPLYHSAVLSGEFLFSLTKGLEILFYSGDFHPLELSKLIKQHKITVMCGTPTMFQILSRFSKEKNVNLKKIALSGECLSADTAKHIQQAFSDAKIYHVYGLTEASPRVSYLPPELFYKHPTSVGFPLRSVEIKVVDKNGRPQCVNRVGELWVKGKNIMLGYYNEPERTQAVLQDGWLCTGDLAFLDQNGLLYIKCRKDDMIIRAGMNIYPQEIEMILKEDPRVEEVLAYGIYNKFSGEAVGLQIKGKFNHIDDILRLCKEKLPPYEQPVKVKIVEEIPKNGSGKMIRRKYYE